MNIRIGCVGSRQILSVESQIPFLFENFLSCVTKVELQIIHVYNILNIRIGCVGSQKILSVELQILQFY